ncbi:helix-turn-helix domain-containing protein [Enterococcus casseliflavus]|uniref:helix-turn-helix domain-containing protein n=1 Tax=Enterococcus casseliflavus TaxID=37734 RepID=UPI000EAF454C|nr:helix-turn-helix domain-containing protein [Enterococcus casseliflavus]AYJ44392.1 DNA-binding protein [Enterococcus casseliflavus]MBS5814402.1 helix-turn-helix domain-containing protein [Enterococcus casseliflavus]MCD4962971.1 helix-turn-helix domain-containing protein [Enterococcus casseliflavus]MDU3373901.1 helix-turn-helix domain-containing protein [Enterococcus casseliflavus]
MNEVEILLSNEQLTNIKIQISTLILTEIENTRNQVNLNCRYMNKKQTCHYLQISNNTLDSWIKQGLPIIKVNGSTRFDKISIDKWLKQLEKTP